MVTGALHHTSREKLKEELGWENFKTRINFLGLCFFHKIHLHETRPLIRSCLTPFDMEKRVTRSKGGYTPYPNYGSKFLNSYFPYISKMWNNLDKSRKCLSLFDFKSKLKSDLKPNKIRHYSKGSKVGNILLTRIRLDRSELNLHRFVIGQSDSPQCLCYARQESSLHFMIDCFLYSVERQVLFGQVEHYVPNFSKLSKIKQYEILVFGLKRENPEYYYPIELFQSQYKIFSLKLNVFLIFEYFFSFF